MHTHYGLIHAASTPSSSQINPAVDLSSQSQQFDNSAKKSLVLEKHFFFCKPGFLSIMKIAWVMKK